MRHGKILPETVVRLGMTDRILTMLILLSCAGCGGAYSELHGGEGGAVASVSDGGSAGAPEPGALRDGEWVQDGACARLIGKGGPWPTSYGCPDGQVECDGSDAVACEVQSATSCGTAYHEAGACVIGDWVGCLPVCAVT